MVLPPPAPASRVGVDSPPSVANSGGGSARVQHQSTPLARLSPSSEVSSQPRILTLQDISGKPLQSALLATTSSSGTACGVGVGKDACSALHSNSERSLNSPVMSQLSGQSSTAKHPPASRASRASALHSSPHPRNSSLVSTLDAHRGHLHHQDDDDDLDDNHSAASTTTDESGNDSFTCSEIEYDNNSVGTGTCGDGRGACVDEDDDDDGADTDRASPRGLGPRGPGKPALPPPPSYDGFDSSFRGSLSTLVASDDDVSTHLGVHTRGPLSGALSPSATALGWDYLLNWGPNFQSLVGVFKDIAELPDSVNGRVVPVPASLRLPASPTKPSEEYV